MDCFRIEGGRRLAGRVTVDGSKNASLPLMAAALLSDGPVELEGVPDLSDTGNMVRLLEDLGLEVSRTEGGAMRFRTVDPSAIHARYDIVRTMRASICVLGPLLARRGRAIVSMPGGCAFGSRPVDLHLRGLEALGARIRLDGGDIHCEADELVGTTIFLGGPFGSTVLGTANIMSAACVAKGTTVIESAACEPEIADLARLLNSMGARITGAGGPRLVIEGVDRLGPATHRVMPDRIVAGTYAAAVAVTNGDVVIEDFPYDSLLAAVDRFSEIGVRVERQDPTEDSRRCSVRVTCERDLRPSIITTQPHPGFPTDLQAQFMTLLCLARGNSIVTEKIYPERFMHVAELSRMGANLIRQGPTVMVVGGGQLVGAPVMASDLRASAGLVMAGLAARGETIVNRVYHLDRGYVRMEETLNALGASVERVDDKELAAADTMAD
ncbi:MAG: UDP-N-acetylglucosamine 1-carboxyvinyltransferase [Planctomycetia bacterium]|nr:UDP-N-acetylglucosamine 1-carboxyvinyltransferase [Planctomycetia bacterium]